jgi:hypothetical protein
MPQIDNKTVVNLCDPFFLALECSGDLVLTCGHVANNGLRKSELDVTEVHSYGVASTLLVKPQIIFAQKSIGERLWPFAAAFGVHE